MSKSKRIADILLAIQAKWAKKIEDTKLLDIRAFDSYVDAEKLEKLELSFFDVIDSIIDKLDEDYHIVSYYALTDTYFDSGIETMRETYNSYCDVLDDASEIIETNTLDGVILEAKDITELKRLYNEPVNDIQAIKDKLEELNTKYLKDLI